jgi:acyl carrier protein
MMSIVVEVLSRILSDEREAAVVDGGDARLEDLGVNSLLLVRFIGELEDVTGVVFADEDLVPKHFGTVGDVCALLAHYTDEDAPATTQPERSAPATPVEAAAVDGGAPWTPVIPEAHLLLCTARLRMTPSQRDQANALLGTHLNWGAFLDLATRHRVLGLVARNFDRECLGPLGTVRRSTLRAAYLYNRGRAQAWERERRDLFAAFSDAGLRPIVRKGSYLAQHVYPDPAMRYMEDMDLYVAEHDLAGMTEVMEQLGYRQGGDSRNRRTVEPVDRETALFWRLNVSALPPFLRPTSDPYVDMFSVDVRRDLMEPASGKSIPAGDFVVRARQVSLAGEDAWAPSHEDMLIDLGVHLYREATTLSSIRSGKDLCLIRFLDITQWYLREAADMDVELLLSLVDKYGVASELYYALHFTDLLYPGVLEPQLLERLRPASLDYLDAYGELDGQPALWSRTFQDRVFDVNRVDEVSALSALPRPRKHWTDDHSVGRSDG